jgi:hypothetical protein
MSQLLTSSSVTVRGGDVVLDRLRGERHLEYPKSYGQIYDDCACTLLLCHRLQPRVVVTLQSQSDDIEGTRVLYTQVTQSPYFLQSPYVGMCAHSTPDTLAIEEKHMASSCRICYNLSSVTAGGGDVVLDRHSAWGRV